MTLTFRRSSVTAACCAATCFGSALRAQETPPPDGAAKPAGVQPTTPPTKQTETDYYDYYGHPRQTSAGGTERKLPDHAGLFPRSPLSYIEPPVKDFEKWLSEKARLDIGFRAMLSFQQASGGPGERTAAAQDYRVYGTWHAFNYEEAQKGAAGNFYTRIEFRDKFTTEITPYQLNTQIGTLFTTTYGHDSHDLAVVQLYYEQFMFDGDLRLRVGKLDPDDYFNLGRWADDYRYFDNTLFSAFPASNHPSGALGFNAQWYVTPEWTLTGGATDVQGKKIHSGFDTVDEGKFFYGLDLTYSPTIDGWGKGNYRVGIEYRDAVEDKGRPEDTSFYFNIDQEIAKDIAPFLRYGLGTGRSTGVDDVFSVGIGFDNCFNRPGDAFGVGIGFDTAHDPPPGARDIEYATEVFYRLQITRTMQFTIGEQIIMHPINSTKDVVGVFELRVVVDF